VSPLGKEIQKPAIVTLLHRAPRTSFHDAEGGSEVPGAIPGSRLPLGSIDGFLVTGRRGILFPARSIVQDGFCCPRRPALGYGPENASQPIRTVATPRKGGPFLQMFTSPASAGGGACHQDRPWADALFARGTFPRRGFLVFGRGIGARRQTVAR